MKHGHIELSSGAINACRIIRHTSANGKQHANEGTCITFNGKVCKRDDDPSAPTDTFGILCIILFKSQDGMQVTVVFSFDFLITSEYIVHDNTLQSML